MKKVLVCAFVLVSNFANSQTNFIGSSIDSVKLLVSKVEDIAKTKLIAIKRSDSTEDYRWKDTSGYVTVTVSVANTKSVQGIKVIESPYFVTEIKIQAPVSIAETLCKDFLLNNTTVIRYGKYFIYTEKWDANIRECTVENKNYDRNLRLPGLAVWIDKHTK